MIVATCASSFFPSSLVTGIGRPTMFCRSNDSDLVLVDLWHFSKSVHFAYIVDVFINIKFYILPKKLCCAYFYWNLAFYSSRKITCLVAAYVLLFFDLLACTKHYLLFWKWTFSIWTTTSVWIRLTFTFTIRNTKFFFFLYQKLWSRRFILILIL